MNTRDFTNRIDERRPRYSEKYRQLIERISQKGEKTGRGNVASFGAFYQTFMYAYVIGLRLGEPKPLESNEPTTDFAPLSKWKPIQLKDFILVTLLNRAADLGYSWMDLENASEETTDAFIKRMQIELESYANRGLEYLQKMWDEEKVRFESPYIFIEILKELENKK